MADYIKTGTDKATGQRVGMMEDGSIVPLQEEPQPGLVEKYAVPFGAVAGGLAGTPFGHPLLGSALGTTGGKYIEQKAKQNRTGKPLSFGETLGGQAGAVGTDLAAGWGIGKVANAAKAIPFLNSARSAKASENIFMKAGKVGGQASKEYGEGLAEAGVKIPLPEVMDVLTDPATDPAMIKAMIRDISKYDLKYGTKLTELIQGLPESISASEAHHLSNALQSTAPSLSRSIKSTIGEALPESFSGLKSSYGQAMRDVDVLDAGIGKTPFLSSERIARASRDPNFQETLLRRMPEEAGTVRNLRNAQNIKDAPKEAWKYLKWPLSAGAASLLWKRGE